MSLVTCTHKGCGLSFDPLGDRSGCRYHEGAPVFHEGQKSWSCCKDVNKPVLTFDDFVAIPGCTEGEHTDEKPKVEKKETQPKPQSNATETYGVPVPAAAPAPAPQASAAPKSTEYVIEEDDANAVIEKGVKCKRKSCGKIYDPQVERNDSECTFHPGAPIFHEGSKGWSCCKRRVLEFDEFLKIEGCRTGRHLFVGAQSCEEELVECRIDHYQTPTQVMVSVFGKGADKESSSVHFEINQLHVDLLLPQRKRFKRTFDLFGPINAEQSSFRILGTKCEIALAKADGRSWPSITALDEKAQFVPQLAFSAGGGRGTIGAKDMILDQTNQAKQFS